MVIGTPHPTLDCKKIRDRMSVVRVLSKFIALQGSLTTVRCLHRKWVHRRRSIMMFDRIYTIVSAQELSHIQHISLLIVPCLHDLYQQDHLALMWKNQTRYMVSGTPQTTLDSIKSEDMAVVRVLSKFIALQGSPTTVRCLRRKLVHR